MDSSCSMLGHIIRLSYRLMLCCWCFPFYVTSNIVILTCRLWSCFLTFLTDSLVYRESLALLECIYVVRDSNVFLFVLMYHMCIGKLRFLEHLLLRLPYYISLTNHVVSAKSLYFSIMRYLITSESLFVYFSKSLAGPLAIISTVHSCSMFQAACTMCLVSLMIDTYKQSLLYNLMITTFVICWLSVVLETGRNLVLNEEIFCIIGLIIKYSRVQMPNNHGMLAFSALMLSISIAQCHLHGEKAFLTQILHVITSIALILFIGA